MTNTTPTPKFQVGDELKYRGCNVRDYVVTRVEPAFYYYVDNNPRPINDVMFSKIYRPLEEGDSVSVKGYPQGRREIVKIFYADNAHEGLTQYALTVREDNSSPQINKISDVTRWVD